MASKYEQLVNLDTLEDLFASSTFLVSKGTWTSDDPVSGDIFTALDSYGIRYNELSNNLVHSIAQSGGISKDKAVQIANAGNTVWNFKTDGGLRVASNGPLSAVTNSDAAWETAVNFETCRALSSDAWWQVHRTCFDAARAREMSGVANRMKMEKGRLVANKFGMVALVYDILNRHWLASDYFKRKNVLTCVYEIDKEKKETTIKNAAYAGITSPLYGLCQFECWSTLPFVYYSSDTPDPNFAINNRQDALSNFIKNCFTYNGKPISYALIDHLNSLSDVKMNIDMSIYDQNRFTSLSNNTTAGTVSSFNVTVNGNKYDVVPYKTLKVAFPPENLPDPATEISSIHDPSAYGPTYMGNIYLYPVFQPYELPLWNYWKDNSGSNFVYQSEPNPCGSKTMYSLVSSTYGNDILFNPQQALWEYHRYYKMLLRQNGQSEEEAEKNALPGDMIHFFEKLCRVQIYFESKNQIEPNTCLCVQYDLAPRKYMLSPSRRGQRHDISVTAENNLTDNLMIMRTGQIEIAGNEPTLFKFKHPEDANDSEWRIWINSMWVW